jgi:hypothetical protein
MRPLLISLTCVLLLSACAAGPSRSFAFLQPEPTREDAMRAYAKWYVQQYGSGQPKAARLPVQMKAI